MQAVSSGHDVVMAQTTHTYFDYYQSEDKENEPHAIGGFLPLSKVYEYEPTLMQMTKEQSKHVLGVQFQVWTEYIRNPMQVEYMVFPRACALAEVAWSPRESRSYQRFLQRLETHLMRLDALEVNYRRN
jgi:hexosaminidase